MHKRIYATRLVPKSVFHGLFKTIVEIMRQVIFITRWGWVVMGMGMDWVWVSGDGDGDGVVFSGLGRKSSVPLRALGTLISVLAKIEEKCSQLVITRPEAHNEASEPSKRGRHKREKNRERHTTARQNRKETHNQPTYWPRWSPYRRIGIDNLCERY